MKSDSKFKKVEPILGSRAEAGGVAAARGRRYLTQRRAVAHTSLWFGTFLKNARLKQEGHFLDRMRGYGGSMSKLKIAFKVMSDVQKWPTTLEACDRLDSDSALSEADRALVAQMRQALTQRGSGKRPGRRPVPPGDMEGVLAELEFLRTEAEELRADRDRWMALYHRAANEVLSLTPQYKFRRPGPLPEPITLKGGGMSLSDQVLRDRGYTEDEIREMFSDPGQDITSESMADHEAGKTLTLDEFWAKIDALAWRKVDMTFEEMDAAKASRGADKETLALLTLLALSSQDVEAGRLSPLAEVLSAIRNENPIKEGIREHMRRKHQTPLQAEVERLQARVKQLVDEALAEAPKDPAQLRQAVIRQLALDLDPSNEPDMDEIQAEVQEVRRSRAGRKLASEIDGPSVGREFGADDADLD